MENSKEKSKALAAWLALLAGGVGAHWFYLYRGRNSKQSWRPWLYLLFLPTGLSILAGFIEAIVFGLQPHQHWQERWNPAQVSNPARAAGLAITAAALGLAATAITVMAGLAILFQLVFSGAVS